MIKDDAYFMKQALLEANKAKEDDEVPIGCVIVLDNKIIARGHNTRQKDLLVISHAEINALKKANKKIKDWQLVNCTIYITLEPCMMCAGAIYQSHIKRVVYGTDEPKGGAFGSSFDLLKIERLNHYPEVTKGVLKEECASILKEYFKQKRLSKNNCK